MDVSPPETDIPTALAPHLSNSFILGGTLCTSSGHRSSSTARISSEIWSTPSISSMYLCRRSILPPNIRAYKHGALWPLGYNPRLNTRFSPATREGGYG